MESSSADLGRMGRAGPWTGVLRDFFFGEGGAVRRFLLDCLWRDSFLFVGWVGAGAEEALLGCYVLTDT